MLHAVVSNTIGNISIWCNIFVTKCEQQTNHDQLSAHTVCVCVAVWQCFALQPRAP